jgi:acetoacetyl-CoA synthetase
VCRAVGDILWQPSPERIAASAIACFAAQNGVLAVDYSGLLTWSLSEPDAFYSALWDFVGIVGEKGDISFTSGAEMRADRFFPRARLNYAENVLRDADDRPAIVAHRDDGTRRALSRRELYDLVSRCTQALAAEGVVAGDRVAGIVTNDIESVALYLACSAIGAIWASCSPDFGPAGAADRLNQIEPKILFAVPVYGYAGKVIDVCATIEAVASGDSIAKVVLISGPADLKVCSKPSVIFEHWLAAYRPGRIAFHRQAFDAPMTILFSSGTTGKPKCIVHSGGGLLLQHMKEQILHSDLHAGDRLFYYTTCGWMMWNWLISGLASGATLVTYDGNPSFPKPDRLVDLIDSERITIFGTSAKYIDAAHKAGVAPAKTHKLDSLRTVLSTGSPLLAESFDYIYRDWKADLHLASISGGTDICGCFLGGVPTLPVRRGELQGPMLGMALSVFGPDGRPVFGAPGELVCTRSHASMPVGFWNDVDGGRYRGAYFERFPGVWTHGDFAEKRPSGGFVIYGRSDTTLNPGGVRIGTAEIYRQVETIAEVIEAVAVGQAWQGDERIVLFVRLRNGQELTTDLEKLIRSRVRSGATQRHVPSRIIAVTEIPRTRSGKISEVAVRDTINGRAVENVAALANPECLAEYRNLTALQG